jgi:hypothetical protein
MLLKTTTGWTTIGTLSCSHPAGTAPLSETGERGDLPPFALLRKLTPGSVERLLLHDPSHPGTAGRLKNPKRPF